MSHRFGPDGQAGRPAAIQRGLAASGIAGVVGFAAAWATRGQILTGYSPFDDAISRLAAIDTPGREWMTAGFVAFGVGVPLFAQALRTAIAGPAWIAATITGFATVGVALAPLGRYDRAHYVFATIGYISLAATPLLAAQAHRAHGAFGWARWSTACAVGSAMLLSASAVDHGHGLTQRLGLSIADLWIVATACSIIRKPRPEAGEVDWSRP